MIKDNSKLLAIPFPSLSTFSQYETQILIENFIFLYLEAYFQKNVFQQKNFLKIWIFNVLTLRKILVAQQKFLCIQLILF